jgi:hypothetical protein
MALPPVADKYIVRPMATSHPSDDGPVIDAHVRCARCGYDLASTRLWGRCPECGLEAMATVAQHADPEVAHLAAPEDPPAASRAVLAATAAPLLALLLQGSGPAMRTVDALAGRGSSYPSQVERPSWLVTAAILAAAATVVARGLSERANPALRASIGAARVRRLAGGLWAWAVLLATAFVLSLTWLSGSDALAKAAVAAQLLPMAFTLHAVAPVLARAGAMARAYREARHGRQGAELVAAAASGAITVWVLEGIIAAVVGEEFRVVATGLAAVLFVFTALGLAYLVANGWVIAAALRAPRIDPRRLR